MTDLKINTPITERIKYKEYNDKTREDENFTYTGVILEEKPNGDLLILTKFNEKKILLRERIQNRTILQDGGSQ